jgi:hypothetical protein
VATASLSTVESGARRRDANTAYLYERIAEGDHDHAEQPDSPHVMRRGTSHDAAQLVRGIIATRDDRARTAHQVAASTDREDLPDRVRSLAEVTQTIADLGDRRITLRALREGVDTGSPTGRAVAAIMATLAELELELGRERRAASRESRHTQNLPASKPPKLAPERQEQLRRLAATGEPIRELAQAFGIGRATAYRYLSQ